MKEFVPDGDVLKSFMRSQAPVKVIQGPIGCLSRDTEFLSPTGWKRMDEWAPGDQVAEWEEAHGEIAFRHPLDYIAKPCDRMWHFRNANTLSMVLSDEHRVPVYDWSGKFQVKTASALAARPSRNTVPVSFIAPEGGGLPLTDSQIRLAVAINADGCFPKRGEQVVITVRKERKKARIVQLLEAAGVEHHSYEHSQRPGEVTFAFKRNGWRKGFGPEWWGANRHQLSVILDECLLWDGLADHAEQRFYTTLKSSADFIQYAAHATGRRATIARRDETREGWSDTYTVFISCPGSAKGNVQLRGDTTEIERVVAPGGM